MKQVVALLLFFTMAAPAFGQKAGWSVEVKKENKHVDVLYRGQLMTSLVVPDSVMKPVLFPVNTVSGITVTRGYPIAPVAGDHVDHPHHTGLWLNFENVNGIDFWNNSTAIPKEKRNLYGHIELTGIFGMMTGDEFAKIRTTAVWKTSEGVALLDEKTDYEFRRTGTEFIIDRITTLTAIEKEVLFKDAKDGLLALRVSSELEQPSAEPLEFIDRHGKITKVAESSVKASGEYLSSRGERGDSVWGTRGRWCMLNGKKDNHPISISIIDHPMNPGYPTYWHARGYGLFSANPMGQTVFTMRKEKLNLKLGPYESATFRFRIVVASEKQSTPARINELADDFAFSY